jgi:hypothetical protein
LGTWNSPPYVKFSPGEKKRDIWCLPKCIIKFTLRGTVKGNKKCELMNEWTLAHSILNSRIVTKGNGLPKVFSSKYSQKFVKEVYSVLTYFL